MSFTLIILTLCSGAEAPEPFSSAVSVTSNPKRQVRLHIAGSDITTRVLDATTQRAVCVGSCDELLSAEAGSRFQVIQTGLDDSPEFTLSGIQHAAVFSERPRNRTVATIGIVVTGLGVLGYFVGGLLFMVGLVAENMGFRPAPWAPAALTGGVWAGGIGIPLALIGLPILLYGLRRPLEVTEAPQD